MPTSIGASVRCRDRSACAGLPAPPARLGAVELAAGRLRVEMAAGHDRRLRRIAALAQARTSSPAHRHALRRPAASQAFRNQSRTCLSSGPQRQPPHAAFRRGAEFGGFMNGAPTAGRSRFAGWRRLWLIGRSEVQTLRAARTFNGAPAGGGVNRDAGLARGWQARFGDALDRDRYRGRRASLPQTSAGPYCRGRSIQQLQAPVRQCRPRRLRSVSTATPRPSMAMWMTVASEALACSRIGGRSGRLNRARTDLIRAGFSGGKR